MSASVRSPSRTVGSCATVRCAARRGAIVPVGTSSLVHPMMNIARATAVTAAKRGTRTSGVKDMLLL